MRRIALLLALLWPLAVRAVSNEACLQFALWKESRGEGLITQRAVYDTIRNRMAVTGHSACHVLRMPQQFPYFKYGVKSVDSKWNIRYIIVSNMDSVLPKNYLYFNSKKHPWGRHTMRIGRLFFSQ